MTHIEEVKTPAPHEQYLHNLGNLRPYQDDIKDAIRKKVKVKKIEGGKADIGDLIHQILETTQGVAEKSWKSPAIHHLVTYDVLREILEDNEHVIGKKGLSDEVVDQIVGQYVKRSSDYAQETYGTQLHQMSVEDARKSVKELATFTGMSHHHRHIDATLRHGTLVNRVHQYTPHVREKVTDMYNRGDFTEKPGGFNDYVHYKKEDTRHGHGGHDHQRAA